MEPAAAEVDEAAAPPADSGMDPASTTSTEAGRKNLPIAEEPAPRTPRKATGEDRHATRSRSEAKKAKKAERDERQTKSRRLRAIVLATGRAFHAKDQITLADLCAALEADSTVQELHPQAWSAREVIKELEAMNKVFVADELVFRL